MVLDPFASDFKRTSRTAVANGRMIGMTRRLLNSGLSIAQLKYRLFLLSGFGDAHIRGIHGTDGLIGAIE